MQTEERRVITEARTEYRAPEAAKLAGISYRKLDYYARTNMIRPSVMEANGSGTQRLYSETDVRELILVRRLLDGGALLSVAWRVLAEVRANRMQGDVALVMPDYVWVLGWSELVTVIEQEKPMVAQIVEIPKEIE